MQNNKIKQMYGSLVSGIKSYFEKNKLEKAVIGVSGGLDSAVCARLVADAIGKENVHGLIMPLKGLSSEEGIMHAVEFCTFTGIEYSLVFIDDFVNEFGNIEWEQNKIAEMNTIARVRAVILYNYANTHNALVIGTSNKTEILLGYFTKYGDGAADIEVIGDLFKTEVKELAKFLEISEKIIGKTPSAELYHGQTDEEELGASYEDIDKILKKMGGDSELAKKITDRVKANEHKRSMPLILKR